MNKINSTSFKIMNLFRFSVQFWVGSTLNEICECETAKGSTRCFQPKIHYHVEILRTLDVSRNFVSSATTKSWNIKHDTVGWSTCKGLWTGKLVEGWTCLRNQQTEKQRKFTIISVKLSLETLKRRWNKLKKNRR